MLARSEPAAAQRRSASRVEPSKRATRLVHSPTMPASAQQQCRLPIQPRRRSKTKPVRTLSCFGSKEDFSPCYRSTDATYADPLGEAVARPRTAAVRRDEDEDAWSNGDVADELPE